MTSNPDPTTPLHHPSAKVNLLGMRLADLQQLCQEEALPKYAAQQICDWMYAKRVDSIGSMTNLSLKARARLNERAYIGRHAPVACQTSRDGTKKYLFQSPSPSTAVPQYVEAVYIPDGDRATLCLSCQMGCRMGCRFCVTGQQGFHGSLDAADILNQILSLPEFNRLTNIVYMGMGEPMDNLDPVLRSCEVLTSPWGLAWSPHRITVSSVGLIPQLQQFLNRSLCHVAVSLHNPFPAERLEVMPMQKVYPIADVIALLKQYNWSGQRRVSFEYTMFHNLNDSTRHAAELVKLLKGLNCRVNLIRFHPSPNTPYKTSSPQRMESFKNYLNSHGLTCTIRASRGEDIMAACGLLAGQKPNPQAQ